MFKSINSQIFVFNTWLIPEHLNLFRSGLFRWPLEISADLSFFTAVLVPIWRRQNSENRAKSGGQNTRIKVNQNRPFGRHVSSPVRVYSWHKQKALFTYIYFINIKVEFFVDKLLFINALVILLLYHWQIFIFMTRPGSRTTLVRFPTFLTSFTAHDSAIFTT